MLIEEIVYLDGHQDSVQKRRARVIYSAREGLYKIRYPWFRKTPGLHRDTRQPKG
jgi:4'-phosphopantetheinyl transferase EntD